MANRLENEFGLRSAYHDFYNEQYGKETYATHHFRWHKDEPFHIDYCFIPAAWELQKVQIGSYDDWGSISDHCPLIVDIDLQPKSVESDAGMDFRNYRKVLRMVAELHLRGYQRLRIAPGMSPSGCHWRCTITTVDNISRKNGAKIAKWGILSAEYTSGQGQNYFGWEDASHASPSQLADMFIKRFPRIAEAGYGTDWIYAGWYIEMLHLTYPESFPIAYADWDLPKDYMSSTGRDNKIRIPLPPPGLGI